MTPTGKSDHDFKLGDRVYCLNGVWENGQVEARTLSMVTVRFDAWCTQQFRPEDLLPLCKNCGMLQRDHADHGKCLYQPTHWAY